MNDESIELLPHNEVAYQKLIKCLENNQMVSINHATGTGKSFIISKYMYKNRNKRILYLSPSYPINDQLIEEHLKELEINPQEFSKLDTDIYRSLLGKNMEELAAKYDIIILDEYHRCGARKWGIKVNQLLDIIKKKYPDKKVVGTTATEIRYLDNEKNMNNILFDGVCASKLSLVDAMLQGILPVPTYINSVVELSLEYERILSIIYKKTFYEAEREYYIQLITNIRNQIEEILSQEENIEKYIKKDGKHLVFSATIEKIETDKKIIDQLLKTKNNKYVVHSLINKKDNAKSLRDFRYDEHPSVLYCVNILNEGVHVKGVDSIFMLRKTTSPIIFFQQLGRLLSYSRRKDKVCVFDFVNNIRQSPYIYELYIDLYNRATELMELDPQNKERYLKILTSFKIVDATSRVSQKLDIIKTAMKPENFYKKRMETVIKILTHEITANEIEEKMATIDLFKYYQFITLEQFKIIKPLEINKPAIFKFTPEEFTYALNGYETLYLKEKQKSVVTIDEINKFYVENGYYPSILSDNNLESTLAQEFIKIYIKEEINITFFENKNISNLSTYEKIVYGLIKDIDFDLLCNDIDNLIQKKLPIYPSIMALLDSKKNEKTKIYVEKIIRYNANETKDKITKEESLNEFVSKEESENLQISYTRDYEEIAKECMIEQSNYKSLEDYLKVLSEEIINYINENYRMPVYYIKNLPPKELQKMRRLYVKKMIFYKELENFGYIDLFNNTYNIVQLKIIKLNKETNLERIIEFLIQNEGDMPSINIESDKELAQTFTKLKNILTEDDLKLLNSYRKDTRTKEVVTEYTNFVKKYKRYPLTTTTNEEEQRILQAYLRNEPYFSDTDKKILNNLKKIVTSRTAMQNAYAELVRQKKQR